MTQLSPYQPHEFPVPDSPPGFYPPHRPYQPAALPERRRQRRVWPWAAGLTAAAMGCVGALAIAQTPVQPAMTGLTTWDANQHGRNAVAGRLGAPSRDGSFLFTVGRVRCGVTSVGTLADRQRAQGRFCLIDLTVQNVGSTGQLFDGSAQKAYDARGAEFVFDGGAARRVEGQDRLLLQNINPGVRARGTLVFDVPAYTRLASVVLHESTFTPGVRVPLP